MRSLPEEQARLSRVVLALQLVPIGIFVGALVAVVVHVRDGDLLPVLPWTVAAAAWCAWIVGVFLTIAMTTRGDARLQRRLDVAGGAATTAAVSGWPTAPGVLSRATKARRNAPWRTAIFVARAPAGSTVPVAVRLAPTAAPGPRSGAVLRLDPSDPAVAVIDPFASPADHAGAASDPVLSGLPRSRRGLALPARTVLSWLGAAVGLAVLTAVLLVVTG